MRFRSKLFAALGLIAVTLSSHAATCTMQAELSTQDRDALAAASGRITQAIVSQDLVSLKADLLPSEASAWEGISGAAGQAQSLTQGGQIQIQSVYLLDAANQAAPADTEFFCSNSSGSLTVTVTMRNLPPGRYAVILANATGSPLGGQLGLVLAWDGSSSAWRLAGLTVRQGVFDGHDGVWYWKRARELAKADPWSAWYSYDMARYLLLPVDFISSPNLDKLGQEQSQITSSPQSAFPLTIPDGDRTWKIEGVRLDASLHEPDLGVAYDSTGVTDPAALRTEAIAVLSAFLKAQPGIRANFHGLWAYSVKNGNRNPIMELPMAKIP
jgi:hypothetical protein